MSQQQHVLEVYEPYEYSGPNPFIAEGIAVLHGPARESFYLLHLDEPVEFEQELIEQLLVLPRYSGDKIDRAVSSTCTVNIARVPPGHALHDGCRLTYEDFLRWGVGKITLNGH